MNEVVDLSFVDRLSDRANEIQERRKRYEEIYRESFQHNMKYAHRSAYGAIESTKDLLKHGGADVTKELAQFDQFINDLTLAVILLKREAARQAEAPTQFWQDEQE